MDNIQSSSLKSKSEVISDLKNLLVLINDGKEGYQSAADATTSPDLKAFFLKVAGERIVDASELTEHIAVHGGEASNEDGGVLGGLHRGWLAVKEVFSSKDDKAILNGITTGERAALAKYDQCIADYADHADHLDLLKEQREGIAEALKEVEQRIVQLN